MGTMLDERGLLAAGRALESARLAAGLNLDQVSASMGVRPAYLEALERGDFGRILGPTYAESMIVRYAAHLGLNPESLLSAATKPSAGVPASPARKVSVPAEAAVRAEAAPATVDITTRPPQARKRSRARAGGWFGARGYGSPLFRVGVVSVLVVALVAVGVFGAAQLGLLSLFDAGDPADDEPSNPSVAIAATADTTQVTAGSTSTATTTVTTTVTSATTTSTTTPLRPTTTEASPAPAAFSLVLTAREDVWVEFRDAASDEALRVGIITKGDSATLEAEGPVNAVVGKPGALSLEVDGRTVEPPNSYRWVIESTGVEERP